MKKLWNSVDSRYGGHDRATAEIIAENAPFHGLDYSGELTLPPFSVTVYIKKKSIKKIIHFGGL